MKRFIPYLYIVCLPLAALWMTACIQDSDDPMIPSEQPITFDVTHGVGGDKTRAIVFEKDSDLIKHEAGGSFRMLAYADGQRDAQGMPRLYHGARVWYNADYAKEYPNGRHWYFLEGDHLTGHTYEVYWPKGVALNMFSYMPYNYETYNRTDVNGTYSIHAYYDNRQFPTIECTMPEKLSAEDDLQEFIYAYNKRVSHGEVQVNFIHPCAVVFFKLSKKSYRLRIDEIALTGISLSGTFSSDADTGTESSSVTSACWSVGTAGNDDKQTFAIGKSIPSDINYETIFAGPFMVIPQSIEPIKLNVYAKRTDAGTENYERTGISLSTASVNTWEPGKSYTYNLLLGDGNEEMLLDVAVDDWIVESYRNVVDIE